MVLDKLIAVSEYVRSKYRHIQTEMGSPVRESSLRLNTNGLGNLINKRSIAREVCRGRHCFHQFKYARCKVLQ